MHSGPHRRRPCPPTRTNPERTAKLNAKAKRSVGVRDGAKRKLFDDDALTVEGILAEAAALAVRQREAREAQKSAKKKAIGGQKTQT